MSDTLLPGLYIVATPIGNLQDITLRAVTTLEQADLIVAEDSRVTAKLLNHLAIKKPMVAYHDHSGADVREKLIERMGDEAVALVSDAGTPLISDPGYKLAREARMAGCAVTTLPGANAAIAALTLAGLPTDRFLFAGFLPPKEKARADMLRELGCVDTTLIFYESGPRLGKALATMAELLGDRAAAIVREITKTFEDTVTGTLSELANRYAGKGPKGEIVIVVGPPDEPDAPNDETIDAALAEALERLPPGQAASEVAAVLGIKRGNIYGRALSLRRRK